MSSNTIRLMLLIYGGANIIGNIAAGKLLTKNANKSVVIFPFDSYLDSSPYLWLSLH